MLHINARIASIATPQYGHITRAQLRALGLSDRAIAHRVQSGQLHRVHRGVYAVGHRSQCWRGRLLAAVLAVGGDAVVDLRDAARLWNAARPSWKHGRRRKVAVLTTRHVRANDPGIEIIRTRSLPPQDVCIIDGIPVVSSERLVVNLAARETKTTMCKLLDELAFHDHLDVRALKDCIARQCSRPDGAAHKASVALALYEDGQYGTDSELEEEALEFNRRHGVPEPSCNVYVAVAGGEHLRVDQCWSAERVIQEVDGGGHQRPTRRREDRRRRAKLIAEGWTVLVLTRARMRDPDLARRAGRRLRRALGLPADA